MLSVVTALALAAGPADIVDSKQVTWVGVDYSRAQLFAEERFHRPDALVPILEGWNYLVREELVYDLQATLHKKVVVADEAVRGPNASFSDSQVSLGTLPDDLFEVSRLTTTDLEAQVGSYELGGTGLGLVFVVESLVEGPGRLCLHAVFFDVPSRRILDAERRCEAAGGLGFRNYWFRPIEQAVFALRPRLRALRRERRRKG